MKVSTYLVAPALALSGLMLGAAPAAAHAMAAHTCTGTLAAPGLLAGNYPGNVVINGVCAVDGGAAVVNGNLTLTPGSALNATFALNDVKHKGSSSLHVHGKLNVEKGAVLVLGCEAGHFPCSDDQNATTHDRVDGNLTGSEALAIIVHATKFDGSVTQVGGGGGAPAMTCAVPTSGVFHAIGSPVYSDYEDVKIAGNLTVEKLRSCWFGALRDWVGGTVRVEGNKFGDPDADEVNSNVVHGAMKCFKNTPAVQYGDAVGGTPNKVSGSASGECAFTVKLHNPVPAGPLTPISVHA
jgi:hypothetical protein